VENLAVLTQSPGFKVTLLSFCLWLSAKYLVGSSGNVIVQEDALGPGILYLWSCVFIFWWYGLSLDILFTLVQKMIAKVAQIISDGWSLWSSFFSSVSV